MTLLMAGMVPRDPSPSEGSDPAWRLSRDAGAAAAALRSITPAGGRARPEKVAQQLDSTVCAHRNVLRELFGPASQPHAAPLTLRLRAELAAAVDTVLRAAFGADMDTVAVESRLAIGGAILALAVAVLDAPEGHGAVSQEQRVALLRSAIRGVEHLEGVQ